DWTWFVPGNAILALLCAGWLAGRGPTNEPIEPREPVRLAVRDPVRIALATGAAAIALVAAWTSWQPQRAGAQGSDALATAEADNYPLARAQIADAEKINPLSVDLLFQQSAIAGASGDVAGARQALQEAVRKEPANAATWLNLAQFELDHGHKPQALSAIGSTLYLDPHSPAAISVYLQASREQ